MFLYLICREWKNNPEIIQEWINFRSCCHIAKLSCSFIQTGSRGCCPPPVHELNSVWLLTDDCNLLLIPAETDWAAQYATAERQHSVQACRCPLHSLTPCPAPAPPLPASPSPRLHFLLVYLLCRRSQASNWLAGLIWQHPPPSP